MNLSFGVAFGISFFLIIIMITFISLIEIYIGVPGPEVVVLTPELQSKSLISRNDLHSYTPSSITSAIRITAIVITVMVLGSIILFLCSHIESKKVADDNESNE